MEIIIALFIFSGFFVMRKVAQSDGESLLVPCAIGCSLIMIGIYLAIFSALS